MADDTSFSGFYTRRQHIAYVYFLSQVFLSAVVTFTLLHF